MGTWGYGIYDNDTFCEFVDLFRDRIREGMSVEDVVIGIQHEYENEADACIASLAVAESLWRLGKLTPNDLNNVKRIIDEGIDCDYWMQLGADEEFIRNRRLALDDFAARLSQAPTKKQKWIIKPIEDALWKGSCFWYKHRGSIYGAIVLETIKSTINYYLIVVSEKMDSIPQTISQVFGALVYTAAWFGDADLLGSKRIHIIGEASISRNFKNKYGIRIEPGQSVYITNCGQTRTWAHSFRQISFDNVRMQDFVNQQADNFYPDVWRSRE